MHYLTNYRKDHRGVVLKYEYGCKYTQLLPHADPAIFWHCSTNNFVNKEYNGMINAELAAFGGDCYHVILSGFHPAYDTFLVNNEGVFLRGSPEIPGFIHFEFFSGLFSTETLCRLTIINGTLFVKVNSELWQIKGLVSALVVSAFLDDPDLTANLGVVKDEVNKVLHFVKIDPGLTFSSQFFFSKDPQHILNFFNDMFLSHPEHRGDQWIDGDLCDSDGEEVRLILDQLSAEEKKALIYSQQGQQELFDTLYSISSIDEHLVYRFASKISNPQLGNQYHSQLMYNSRLWTETACKSLPGFGEYLRNKTRPYLNLKVDNVSDFANPNLSSARVQKLYFFSSLYNSLTPQEQTQVEHDANLLNEPVEKKP